MQDNLAAGLPLLGDALEELRKTGAAPGSPAFLAMFARALGRAGRVSEGLATIEQALMLSERYEERWCLPELLRHNWELCLLDGSRNAALAAEERLRQSLDCAHRDGTLAWELRAAISFARLRQKQHRRREARDLLAPVYHRFTEAFDTADLQT